MFKAAQLRELIIKPALNDLAIYCDSFTELLVFTCATESAGGTYLHQINGPALGIYQMEPATYNDIWQNYINNKTNLKLQLLHHFNAPVMPDENRLIYDLRFATVMAAILYLRAPERIRTGVIDDLWSFYKAYWNTIKGKARMSESVDAYDRFIHS